MANRVILGEFGGDYVLRVSRPGFNVLDPALPRQNLAFDSRWPENMNIVASGTLGYSGSAVSAINHGMGYGTGPACFAWFQYGGYIYQPDLLGPQVSFDGGRQSLSMSVTTSQLRFTGGGDRGFPPVTVHYLVLRNSNG